MGTKLKENPSTNLEKSSDIIGEINQSLSLLEKETWIQFFEDASKWIKNLFGFDGNNEQISENGTSHSQNTLIEQSENTNNLKVSETWNYITNGGTFYSPTKGICKRNKYRGVCSTGSFNILRKLGLPKVSNSTEVDLKGDTLTQMGLKYIGKVNPKNPGQKGYKPQNGDTAVRPKFTKKSGETTQHQATYINGHWVSDNIQNKMSCYPKEPNEPDCKIYRYMG